MVIEISNTDTFTGQSKNVDLKAAKRCTYRGPDGKMHPGWVDEDGDIVDSNGVIVREFDRYSNIKVNKDSEKSYYIGPDGKRRACWKDKNGQCRDADGSLVRSHLVNSLVRSPTAKRESVVKPSVTHPDYYKDRKIEPIDVIEAWDLDFCLGNAIKYIARAGKKDGDSAEEDLSKAVWYIHRYLDRRYV